MNRLINISLICGLSALVLACGGGTLGPMPTNTPTNTPTSTPTSTPHLFASYLGEWVQCVAIPGVTLGMQGANSGTLFGLQTRLTLTSSGLNAKEVRASRVFQNTDCTGALIDSSGGLVPLPNKYRGVPNIMLYQASGTTALQSAIANRAYLFDELGGSLPMKMLVYLEAQQLKLIPMGLYDNWDQNTYDPAKIETYVPFP